MSPNSPMICFVSSRKVPDTVMLTSSFTQTMTKMILSTRAFFSTTKLQATLSAVITIRTFNSFTQGRRIFTPSA